MGSYPVSGKAAQQVSPLRKIFRPLSANMPSNAPNVRMPKAACFSSRSVPDTRTSCICPLPRSQASASRRGCTGAKQSSCRPAGRSTCRSGTCSRASDSACTVPSYGSAQSSVTEIRTPSSPHSTRSSRRKFSRSRRSSMRPSRPFQLVWVSSVAPEEVRMLLCASPGYVLSQVRRIRSRPVRYSVTSNRQGDASVARPNAGASCPFTSSFSARLRSTVRNTRPPAGKQTSRSNTACPQKACLRVMRFRIRPPAGSSFTSGCHGCASSAGPKPISSVDPGSSTSHPALTRNHFPLRSI